MKILICVGANSRIIQHCLNFCQGFSKVHLFYRSKYDGNISSRYIHHKYEDVISLLVELQKILNNTSEESSLYMLYSSFYTLRHLAPKNDDVWDSPLATTIQSMALNNPKVRRLIIMGSTQVLLYPFKKDFYLNCKGIELMNFQINRRLDSESKICYFALPPLDASSNIIGRIFVRSRMDCAINIVKELGTRSQFCCPQGLYHLYTKYIVARGASVKSY